MLKRTLLLVLPVALLAAACGSDGGDTPTDHAWDMIELQGADGALAAPIEGSSATLAFDGDTAAGNASCNQYFGSFSIDGSSISFGPLASTEMFCGDEGLMDQEMAYLAALEVVDEWSVDDEHLTLAADGTALIRYAAISQELADTAWELIAYNNGTGGFQSAIVGTPVTAAFAEDGAVAGSAGCNDYTASWETDDGTIAIGPAASTAMACADDEVMTQEARYLELLGLAATYRVDAGALEMFDGDGTRVLQYGRSAE